MTVPDPPANVTPPDFKAWADAVTDDTNAKETPAGAQAKADAALGAANDYTDTAVDNATSALLPHTAVAAISALNAGTNRCVYQQVKGAGPISQVRVLIGVSSGNVAAAVYADNGGVPGDRAITSGIMASPGAGDQDIPLGASVEVAEGDWLALWADNATVTFYGAGSTTLRTGVIGPCLIQGSTTSGPPPTAAPTHYLLASLVALGH